MRLEQNQISRDWTILHKGRTFYVNFTEADGQTLALCNRDNWEVWEATEDAVEELNEYCFNEDRPSRLREAKKNAHLKEWLIKFCMENWYNQFMYQIDEQFLSQKKLL